MAALHLPDNIKVQVRALIIFNEVVTIAIGRRNTKIPSISLLLKYIAYKY